MRCLECQVLAVRANGRTNLRDAVRDGLCLTHLDERTARDARRGRSPVPNDQTPWAASHRAKVQGVGSVHAAYPRGPQEADMVTKVVPDGDGWRVLVNECLTAPCFNSRGAAQAYADGIRSGYRRPEYVR